MTAVRQAFVGAGLLALAASAAAAGTVEERLRERVEALAAPSAATAADRAALEALPRFYRARLHRPAWTEGGRTAARAAQLRGWIEESARHGLEPSDYHAEELERLTRQTWAGADPDLLAELDLLHTHAFLSLAAHLVHGRVLPEAAATGSEGVVAPEADLAVLLENAIVDNAVAVTLESLLPHQAAYAALVDELARLRELAADGEWSEVPDGPTLEVGDQGPRVSALRRRLEATEAVAPPAVDDLFDESLATAVRRFQRRHGLEPDAKVGPRTLEALRVPAADRAAQVALNLERWRWLPESLGERFILVNVPGFSLHVFEGEAAVLSMRAIVGRPYRRTPVFSDLVRYLVLNPTWEVPRSIAVLDELPLIRRDPGFLTRMGFRVLTGWGADERVVDPASVDWSALGPGNFPYRLRQQPGPYNALGRIKFMFPNRFNVYLHDTPSRELFDFARRDFSSGCIRIDRPLDLAEHVLRDDPRWTRAALEAAIASGRTQTVSLPSPLPIHVQYWTAWVDPEGTLHFRNDLYGRDARLETVLRARGSRPPA